MQRPVPSHRPKAFDFAMVPGAAHAIGSGWGVPKRNDFFVENILGVKPPDWNRTAGGGGSR